MDAETQAAIAFWNTGNVVGSSNLTMSVPQQAVYFTASDKEVAAYRQSMPSDQQWMSDADVAYLIRRRKQVQ